MILTEFDSSKSAIINPEDLVEPIENFPEVVVSCFARETFKQMVEAYQGKEIARTSIANMEFIIYEIIINNTKIGLINSAVGAPACIGILEDLIPMGMKKLVLFGTCGVLDTTIEDVAIVIPTSALRDEGTSFHYALASDEITLNPNPIQQFTHFLEENNIPYTQGKAWTTDAIYRETKEKVKRRKEQGCIVVDMECSAVAAWAQFRQIECLHFFYAADVLSEIGWDKRSLSNNSNLEDKAKIADIAISFASQF